jgi:hypothetical protein
VGGAAARERLVSLQRFAVHRGEDQGEQVGGVVFQGGGVAVTEMRDGFAVGAGLPGIQDRLGRDLHVVFAGASGHLPHLGVLPGVRGVLYGLQGAQDRFHPGGEGLREACGVRHARYLVSGRAPSARKTAQPAAGRAVVSEEAAVLSNAG